MATNSLRALKALTMSKLYHNNLWLWGELIGTGAEWIDIGLPAPSLFVHTSFGAYVGWLLEGYFGTDKNKQFLRDVAERLALAFALEEARWRWLPFRPETNILEPIYNLKDDIAPALPSKAETRSTEAIEALAKYSLRLSDKSTEDLLFDAIRFRVYDFVNANSVEALTLDYVMLIAEDEYERIGSKKGISTARAKARAIYKWVKERYRPATSGKWNWDYKRKTKTDEELEMTRRENITKINKLRAIEKRKKVEQAVESLKFLNEKISVRKVAEYAKVSTKTAQKYLKEFRSEGRL